MMGTKLRLVGLNTPSAAAVLSKAVWRRETARPLYQMGPSSFSGKYFRTLRSSGLRNSVSAVKHTSPFEMVEPGGSLRRHGRSYSSTSTGPGIEVHDQHLELHHNGKTVPLNLKWLRENCRCPRCYNHDSFQRNVLFYELDHRKSLRVNTWQLENDELAVVWGDEHQSKYSLEWIQSNSYPGQPEKMSKHLWNAKELGVFQPDGVDFASLRRGPDGALQELLRSLLKFGFGLVHDVPATVEATQEAVEHICFVQETLFGRMWSFTSDMARRDTAYTSIALGAHTDTSYLACPAGIQVFHCLDHGGDGGETLLVDGFHAAEQLRSANPEAFQILERHRVHHEYIGDGYHMRSLDPVIKTDLASGELEMIRYNHYDRAPIVTLPQERLEAYYEALALLSARVTDPDNEFWIKLRPGIVLFLDNWRVMHGRSAFSGMRSMCGCYLGRDDWISKTRTQGLL